MLFPTSVSHDQVATSLEMSAGPSEEGNHVEETLGPLLLVKQRYSTFSYSV